MSNTLNTIAALRALLVPGEYRPAAAYDEHGEDTDSTLIRCGAMDVATAPEDHAAAIIALHNAAPEVLALAERAALVDAVREVWGDPEMTVSPFRNKDGPAQWVAWGAEDAQGRVISAPTEQAAWTAALEAGRKARGGNDAE
jgi:hypothetical protein